MGLLVLAIMDAIKKKMQAMKVEKDNAMDRYVIHNGSTLLLLKSEYFPPRSDVCEQQAKEAKIRAAKAEEEVMI